MNNAKLIENFESIASALFDEAPSEKARQFVTKIADQIRARGEGWIIENCLPLHITMSAADQEDIAPVEDNRLWYIAQWQVALAK